MTVLCCCFLKRQTDKKRLAFMRRDSGVHASATLPGNRYFMLSLYKITWSFCFVGKFHFLPFAFERVLMKPTSKHVSIESIHRLILFQACLPLKTRLWTHISCDFCLCLLVPLWNRPVRCSSFPRSVSFSSCFRLHRSPVFPPQSFQFGIFRSEKTQPRSLRTEPPLQQFLEQDDKPQATLKDSFEYRFLGKLLL